MDLALGIGRGKRTTGVELLERGKSVCHFALRLSLASMGDVEVVATWSVGGDGFNVNTWSKRDQTTAFAVNYR